MKGDAFERYAKHCTCGHRIDMHGGDGACLLCTCQVAELDTKRDSTDPAQPTLLGFPVQEVDKITLGVDASDDSGITAALQAMESASVPTERDTFNPDAGFTISEAVTHADASEDQAHALNVDDPAQLFTAEEAKTCATCAHSEQVHEYEQATDSMPCYVDGCPCENFTDTA